MTTTLPPISATSVVSIENVLQCITAYVVVARLGSSKFNLKQSCVIESMHVPT